MDIPTPTVRIVPLVPHLATPVAASGQTRAAVPPGPGVQEHCLPFTAASALGFLIPSPIRFGWCRVDEVPAEGRSFRSPIGGTDAGTAESRVFYVVDDQRSRFASNAYAIDSVVDDRVLLEPGISFFDRPDQQHLFKLHLPYIWQTPEAIDTLFGPLINRPSHGLDAVSGLVETDWYASPVNLVLRAPSDSVHVMRGEPVAHAMLLPRECRRPRLDVAEDHSRASREARRRLAEWEAHPAADHQAYKQLARSRHGRLDG
jgi:hypothetical protein